MNLYNSLRNGSLKDCGRFLLENCLDESAAENLFLKGECHIDSNHAQIKNATRINYKEKIMYRTGNEFHTIEAIDMLVAHGFYTYE